MSRYVGKSKKKPTKHISQIRNLIVDGLVDLIVGLLIALFEKYILK